MTKIPHVKFDAGLLAVAHSSVGRQIARIGQEFERAVMGVACGLDKTPDEARALVLAELDTGTPLSSVAREVIHEAIFGEFKRLLAELAPLVDPPVPTVTPEPAPTCPPIGARLGRRLGVRRR